MKKNDQARLKKFATAVLVSENFVLYLCILYFIILSLFVPRMAGYRNLANISSNMWPLLALAVGQMFVLVVGCIDLSQTSIMATTSVLGAMFMTTAMDPVKFEKSPLWGILVGPDGGPLGGSEWSVVVGVAVMLTGGVLIGLVNGVSVARFKMPPFIVTLVSMMFFSGFAIYLTKSENIMHLPRSFIAIGRGGIGFVSFSFIIVLVLAAGAWFYSTYTVGGKWLYSAGRNKKTARVSGVPVDRVVIGAYMFSGFCAALGSVLYSARLEGGRPTLGENLLLDIIGSAVIGGISLYGGKGKILWAVFGVLFFTLLANSLNMMNLSYFTINIVKGSVILLAALLDVTRNKLAVAAGGAR